MSQQPCLKSVVFGHRLTNRVVFPDRLGWDSGIVHLTCEVGNRDRTIHITARSLMRTNSYSLFSIRECHAQPKTYVPKHFTVPTL